MKRKLLSVILLTMMGLSSCDIYKDDEPAMLEYNVKYRAHQPVLFNLNNSADAKKFRIKLSPNSGEAEIIGDSFLKYSPTDDINDYAIVEILDQSDSKLGEAKVTLELSESACGIAAFSYANITNDSVLSMDLANAELVCEKIYHARLLTNCFENCEGLSIRMPNNFPEESPIKIEVNYQPPVGFKGTVRAVYSVYINTKDEYLNIPDDILSTDYDIEEYSKFKVTALVEINVE